MNVLLIISVVVLPIIIVWMLAVANLMTRRDDAFRGQFDKLAWAIILAFTGLFGAIVYFACTPGMDLSTSDSTDGESTVDEPFECLECGAAIPADALKCTSCGWSYSQSETAV